jgi:LCP family protein required for cell wall assembly
MPEPPQEPPPYTLYRSRPRLLPRNRAQESPLDELRGDGRPPGEQGRRRWFRLAGRGRVGKPWSVGRVVKVVALAIVGWLLLSFVLFMISATFNQDKVSDEAKAQLTNSGYPLWSANTILVLGSDARPKGSKEPGANSGPSRSDSILLVRTGGGHSAKLSIPRDTVVDIPGHGRNKINAAYAIGGAALTVETIKQYLGIDIDHVFEVNFDNFPDLVDAMGGINYTGGCVVSRINGGFKNGGFTLRLRRGTTHIDGRQALALARTRHNDCNPKENDLTRARRQQKVISAMKSRVFSPAGFVRLPFISWNAPKTLKTDMRGPALLGYAIGTALSGSAQTEILKPSGGVTLPDGGAGLVVSDAEKQADVKRFLAG